MELTKEQALATTKKGTNILVSAGAGSGKTAVLKERVLNHLKSGVNIDNLIILTFTNNAALEMKDRIRKIIKKNPEVKDQEELLDSAYITTFDSFAGSIVRKYNYLLGVSKSFGIIEESIVNSKINEIIDEIFENKYEQKEDRFLKLISDFCVKDDKEIRKAIKKIYQRYTQIIDKEEFLNTYEERYLSNDKIQKFFTLYENNICNEKDKIARILENLEDETIDSETLISNRNIIANFLNSSTYEEVQDSYKFSLERYSDKKYTEKGKELKDKISKMIKSLASKLYFSKEELLEQVYSTKDYILEIINIIQMLDTKLMEFKKTNNLFEFNDIALLAIKLVKENPSVCEEIKAKTYEIMIDEYQDTNDIQETFISYIANNNVYMVGDIKQSIYRFRNANPYIFKNKYDKYKNDEGGFKIDLNKNFRSRKEVVSAINTLFNTLMTDDFGGANYQKEHTMVYGNEDYNKYENESYDLELYNYEKDSTNNYNNDEIEAFIIANDILNKVKSGYEVTTLKNDVRLSKKCSYSDFAILVDKSNNFELLKKVLEYHNIPTSIYKDVNIKDDDEIYILKNIINLIIEIKKIGDKDYYSNEFKHYYASITRSYLSNTNDNELYKIFTEKTYKNTDIYQKCLEISEVIDAKSIKDILYLIIQKFDFYNKVLTTSNIKERINRIEFFIKNASNLNNFGMDIYKVGEYFDELLSDSENKITMKINKESKNSVKIMTIHGSKGLEFPVVYFPYLNNNFVINLSKEKWLLDNNYGIITPYWTTVIGKTFLGDLYQFNEKKETISEKIRLFYVAITRAKEKAILINNFEESESFDVANMMNYKSYKNMLDAMQNMLTKFITNVDVNNLGLTKDYNLTKESNLKEIMKGAYNEITTQKVDIPYEIKENRHFSKSIKTLINENLRKTLDYGTYLHYVFEVADLKQTNFDYLDIEESEKKVLENFIKHEEMKDIQNANIYKEYEIYFEKDNNMFHGFIDLLLEYDDHFEIIDYKTSNVDDENYDIQLNGYTDYMETKLNKKGVAYLYSIKKDYFKKVQR